MTQIDQIIADALAGSPETYIAILAREVVRLREAPAVVVPPLPKTTGYRADDAPVWGIPQDLEDVCLQAGNPVLAAYQAGIRRGHAIAGNSARAIPADRVLGEGMVAVDRKALERLRRIETCARDFQERQRNLTISQDSYGFFQADNALESALRANQGGASHD